MDNIIEKLNAIPVGDSHTPTSEINKTLVELNKLSSLKIHEKEINFCNKDDRKEFCKKFPNEDPKVYGVSLEMVRNLDRTNGTVFLCGNRDTRSNCWANEYKNASSSDEKSLLWKLNAMDLLSWHSTVIYYKNRTLYYFDSRMDRFVSKEKRILRGNNLNYKSKLDNFYNLATKRKIPIDSIYVCGLGETEPGKCRVLALTFIKDLIRARIENKPLSKYFFKEFLIGPAPPGPNREMRNLNSIS